MSLTHWLLLSYFGPLSIFVWVALRPPYDPSVRSMKAWLIRIFWPIALAFIIITTIYYLFSDLFSNDPDDWSKT